jgi:hypothetical protein
VRDLAKEIWGDGTAKKNSGRSFRKGRVFESQPLPSVLEELETPPDFQADVPQLHWTHRRDGDADFYFIANPAATAVTTVARFRVAGRLPEFWRPDSGEMVPATAFHIRDGVTHVPVTLDASGSVFVVFRKAADGNTASGKTTKFEVALPEPLAITGPWELRFPPKLGAPESVNLPQLVCWTKHADPGIRHFSGTATYHKTLEVPAAWLQFGQTTVLDLGEVQIMARVKLNGHDLGILWKPPYRVEVGKHLQAGPNTLEIDVVNLWPNRMIGDAALPEDQRISWSAWQPFKPDSPLLPSGLLGPVRLTASNGGNPR